MAADKTLWFRHDIGTMNDIRMQKIMRKYGLEGIGIYWCLVESLYTNDGKIFFSEITDIAFMIHASEKKVAEMARDQDIFESDEESFWSNRVNSELSIQQEVSERAKEAINARWKNQRKAKNNNSNPSDNSEKSYERNTDVIRPNYDSNTGVSEVEYVRNTQTDRQTDNTDRQREENTSSELPQKSESVEAGPAPGSPVYCTIITNTREEYPITEEMVGLWESTYPAVNVKQQLLSMKAWSISNPKKRKTKAGMMGFVNNWLSKEQDKPAQGSSRQPINKPSQFTLANEERWAAYNKEAQA
ncbi:MAG: DUF4373 domain-containing protein [Sphaerochaeta sp.]|nr:DUF4373 domain-containing protein [Sphaerochaeta sp.]